MKLTNLQVLNPQFVQALEKLLKKEMPLSTCAKLAEVLVEIEKKAALLQKIRTAMVDKYLEKDAQGKPVVIDGSKPKYKSAEAQEKFMGELNELLKGDFEVPFDEKVNIPETEAMVAQEYLLIKDFISITKKSTGALDAAKK
jgi:hypothetical protein